MNTKNILLAAAILVAAPAFAQVDTTTTDGHHAVNLTLGSNGADVKLLDLRDSSQVESGYDTLRLETRRKHITILLAPKPMASEDSLPQLLKDLRRQRRNAYSHWGGMDLGFNSFIATDGRIGDGPKTNGLALNSWRSRFIAFNLAEWKIEFGSHHAGLLTGLGIEFRNYHFADNTVLTDVADTTFGAPVAEPDFTKNKLRQIGFRVPVMLEFNTKRAPLPTTLAEAVAMRSEGFSTKGNVHLAFGVVGSLYFDTMYKQKFSDEGSDKKVRSKDNYNLLPYNVAATVRLGVGGLTLFAEYSLTTLFEEGGSPELVPVTIGIQLLDF
ncbi:MAG: hypothetical protein ABI599_02380 [Flavobacteriales bacterium]